MFEKSILIVYFNISGIENDTRSKQTTASLMNYLNRLFSDEKDLKILVIPVRDQQTKVELLNASYPKWEEILEQIQQSNLDLLQNEES
jgi:hypothetical protein